MNFINKKKIVLANMSVTPGKRSKFPMLPLGILYIGSYLEKLGHDIVVIDANLEGLTAKQVANKIIYHEPEWVGFGCMTDTLSETIEAVRIIKEQSEYIKICIGGPHINATKEEFFDYNTKVDYLIYGEGEIAFSRLITAREDELKNVNGLIYKNVSGKIVKNKQSEYIKDLNKLPWLNYELIESFNINNYKSPFADRKPELHMIISRGCPYKCSFCNVGSTFGRTYRVRDVNDTINEIKEKICKYGVKYIIMKDSTFNVNKKWVQSFCIKLIDECIDIHWRCNTRIDLVDKELFTLMYKAGCRALTIGVESGDQKILDIINKGIKVEDIPKSIKILRKIGFILHCSFIIGSPGETPETIKKTVQLCKKIRPFFAQFCAATAYPDNFFYSWGIETKALADARWYLSGRYKNEALYGIDSEFPGSLRFKEFDTLKEVRNAYKKFYFSFEYMLTIYEIARMNFFYFSKLIAKIGVSFIKSII